MPEKYLNLIHNMHWGISAPGIGGAKIIYGIAYFISTFKKQKAKPCLLCDSSKLGQETGVASPSFKVTFVILLK